MLTPIGPLNPAAGLAEEPAQREQQIRHIATEFEAMLVSAMLKEGLKSASQTGIDGEEETSSTYMEMTSEQLASFIGRQGVLGIADQIVESLRLTPKEETHAND